MADVTHLGASPTLAQRIAAVLSSKAFLGSARLDQRPDNAEVLTARVFSPIGEKANVLEEGAGQIRIEQLLSMPAPREVISDGNIDTKSDEAAVRQVEAGTLNQRALGTQRGQDLQQQFLQQHFISNTRLHELNPIARDLFEGKAVFTEAKGHKQPLQESIGRVNHSKPYPYPSFIAHHSSFIIHHSSFIGTQVLATALSLTRTLKLRVNLGLPTATIKQKLFGVAV
jgi:hypothetical protein